MVTAGQLIVKAWFLDVDLLSSGPIAGDTSKVHLYVEKFLVIPDVQIISSQQKTVTRGSPNKWLASGKFS
jgi:hypothetical protein